MLGDGAAHPAPDVRQSAPDGIRPCEHKVARHQHGSRDTYVLDRCRCRPCKDAASAYERHRHRQRAYGRQAYVDAAPAREHVRSLMAAGMGRRRVAHVAGVPGSTVTSLLYGRPAHEQRPASGPSARILGATATALLAVRVDLAPGARTASTGSTRRLQALIAVGWSQSRLAERLGTTVQNLGPLVHGTRDVTAATATAVRVLYNALWDQAPPAATRHQAASVTRAKGQAATHGWVPPLAWDDDALDDPTATPAPQGERGGVDLDDVDFLLRHGETRDGIGRRLGVNPDYVLTLARRAGRTDVAERLRAAA